MRAGELLLVASGDDDGHTHHLDVGGRGGHARACCDRGERELLQRAAAVERVHEEAVGHLAGHGRGERPEPRGEDRRWPARIGPRVERRDHPGVGVELAVEVEANPVSHASQIALIASTISRMRAAGFDHGIE